MKGTVPNWQRALWAASVAAVWAGNFALLTDAPGWAVYGLAILVFQIAYWSERE